MKKPEKQKKRNKYKLCVFNKFMRQTTKDIFLKNHQTILWRGLFLVFLFFLFTALPSGKMVALSENDGGEINLEENKKLIDQKLEEIKQVQNEISKYDLEIKDQQKKVRTLARDISIYNSTINKNELEIEETRLATEETELKIEEIENKIKESEERIEKDRALLKDFVKLLYSYEQDSILEMLITKDNLSDFFNEVDAVEYVKDEIFETIVNLKNEKEEARLQMEEFEEQNEERLQLIQMRFEQNSSLNELKNQKDNLLEITKGEEKKFQQILEENKNILPSLKAQLKDLQSLGREIKFNDAISAAKYISSLTGVRAEFLLGVLRVESGLGTNIGGGTYKIDMRPNNRATFEAITAELGYNPDEMPVSRKPKNYSGWGGAMGPAQMMPKTWMAYKEQVSEITGHYPPDPWDLTDAITAMAVKLAGVPGVTQGNYDAEYRAAGIYFAGSNWRRFLFYPDKVMLYANLYAEEIN